MRCPSCKKKMIENFITNELKIKPHFTLYLYVCDRCGDEATVKKHLNGDILSIQKGYATREDRQNNLKNAKGVSK